MLSLPSPPPSPRCRVPPVPCGRVFLFQPQEATRSWVPPPSELTDTSFPSLGAGWVWVVEEGLRGSRSETGHECLTSGGSHPGSAPPSHVTSDKPLGPRERLLL